MIQVTVARNGKGEYKSFEVKGHAGFDKKGRDIVCAAVSMLVINTINAMEEFTETCPVIQEQNGLIKAEFEQAPDEKAELLLNAMMLGIRGAAEEYGTQYITVSEKEVTDASL